MSSHRDSSNYFRATTWFSEESSSFVDELPDDLETARVIIENLTRQLKIHDDVTSDLIFLQKRIRRTHQRTQNAIQMLEDRLDNIEAIWTKELEDQHKCWLDKYNRLMREAEDTRTLNKVTPKHNSKNMKISEQQLECLNRRTLKVDEGIGELEKVSECNKNFDEKLHLDKQKIKDIDARLKALTKREQKLNAELIKQMNVHFHKPFVQITKEQSEQSFYGVFEIIDGYQKTIENLDKALRTLEQIRKVPAMKSINSTIQNIPSVNEIDEITVLMRRFMSKLLVQLISIHSYGNSALNPLFYISKSVSLTDYNSDQKLGNLTETTTGFGPSKRSNSSNFDRTPLNSLQHVPTGLPSSFDGSQFTALKSEISCKETITAKEKSEQISNDKKK